MATRTFGTEVKRLRLSKSITQRVLAESADIDVTYLSKIESGKVAPPAADKIIALANALGVDPDELLVLAKKAPRDLVAKAIAGKPEVLKFLRQAPTMSRQDLQHALSRSNRRKKAG